MTPDLVWLFLLVAFATYGAAVLAPTVRACLPARVHARLRDHLWVIDVSVLAAYALFLCWVGVR